MQELVVDNVSIKIGGTILLDHINIRMNGGKIYGLRGRNGSGKTVLMKCICGFMKATEGNILLNGKRIGKDVDFLPDAGIIIEEPGFFPQYSGYENLKLLAGIQGKVHKNEIKRAMNMVELDPGMKKHVGKYSLGMRQRLGIAQAVMENPSILILDEPTNGLDEEGVIWLRKFLMLKREEGKLILIASHVKEDVDIMCDQIWHMEKGKIG